MKSYRKKRYSQISRYSSEEEVEIKRKVSDADNNSSLRNKFNQLNNQELENISQDPKNTHDSLTEVGSSMQNMSAPLNKKGLRQKMKEAFTSEEEEAMDVNFPALPPSKPIQKIKIHQKESANTVIVNIPTKNRFSALTTGIEATVENKQTEEKTGNNNKEEQKVTNMKIPPIIIKNQITNYKVFNQEIKDFLQSNDYSVSYLRDHTKIYTKTLEHFNRLKTEFIKEKMECYTFSLKSEREKKIVLKAAPNMDPSDIKKSLIENNIQVNNCISLKSKKSNSFSYLITMPQQTNIKQVREITNIENIKAKWEPYTRKNLITQCHRCQQFGHGQNNCYSTPKCVKCAKNHLTADCTMVRTPNTTAKCCNCGGNHPANYKKCDAYLDYLQKRQNSIQKNQKPKGVIQPKQFSSKFITPNMSFSQITNKQLYTGSQVMNNQTTKQSNKPTLSPQYVAENMESIEGPYNAFTTLINEIKELNKICNLDNLIKKVKMLRQQFTSCSSELEQISVLQRILI